jgi:hypothetical protein
MNRQSEYLYDVFISYADTDRAWVEGYLLDTLLQAGVHCHSATAFKVGVPRLLEFEQAIQQSRRILLVLSPAYLADDVNQFTDLLAQSYGLETATWPVIPLVLHPVKLPPRLVALVSIDATDPADWLHTIKHLCEELQRPLFAPALKPPCPYPGMVPFRESDSHRFFGREREMQEMVERLRLHPFLAVIGRSGSGKSSLVFAGLIPTLRKSSLFGPGEWIVRILRPGETPLKSLRATLDQDSVDPVAAVTQIVGTARTEHFGHQHLLLVIDQFEELFTLAQSESLPFQETLLQLIKIPGCYLILTIRSDFYDDVMGTPLWSEIQVHRLEVLPLDSDGLRQAIVRPAEELKVFIDPVLVERLVTEAAGEPGILPLVQETLVLLWERLERRFLPLSAYEALASSAGGKQTGLQVAMARRANATLAGLSSEQQAIARRIFLRLVQFGAGRPDTRRQQPVAALYTMCEDPSVVEQTLDALTNARLLTLSGEEGETAHKHVDIAHEALISGWPALQEWVSDRQEAEKTRRILESKAQEWVRLGQGAGGLLDATELTEAEQWLESSDAGELGYSEILLKLVETSRTTINPGWHRWGTISLLLGGLAFAALLGVLYVQTEPFSFVWKIPIWITVVVALFVMFGFLRKSGAYLGQQLSHMVVKQRRFQIGVGILMISAVALWVLFGIETGRLTAYCEHLGYQRPSGNIIHIAVIDKGLQPLQAEVFNRTLLRNNPLKSWIVTPENGEKCTAFFTYRLELSRTELPNSQEVSFSVEAKPPLSNKPKPIEVGPERCEMLATLAHKVLEQLGIVSMAKNMQLPPAFNCRYLILTEDTLLAINKKNYKEAESYAQEAVKLEPNHPIAHQYLGLVYLDTERYPQAIAELKMAHELLPGYVPFLTDLATACYRQGDYECAERNNLKLIHTEFTDSDPNYWKAIAYNNLSIVYRAKDEYMKAQVALAQGMKLLSLIKEGKGQSGKLESALYKNQGILDFCGGKWSEAIETLKYAHQIDRDFEKEILYYLARSYEEMGDESQACQYWQHYDSTPSDGLFKERERQRDDVRQRQHTCQD